MWAIHYLISIIVLLLGVGAGAVVLLASVKTAQYFVPSRKVVYFAGCAEGGAASPALARELEGKFNQFFRETFRLTSSGIYEQRYPRLDTFRISRARTTGSSPKISFVGVNLDDVATALRSVLRPGGLVFRVEIDRSAGVMTSRVHLSHLGRTELSTSIREVVSSGDGKAERERLVDASLFLLMRHWVRDRFEHEAIAEARFHSGLSFLEIHRSSGNYDALVNAATQLQAAVREEPQWMEARYLLALARSDMGEVEASIDVLRSLLELIEESKKASRDTRSETEKGGWEPPTESPGAETKSVVQVEPPAEFEAEVLTLLGTQLMRSEDWTMSEEAKTLLENARGMVEADSLIGLDATLRLAMVHAQRVWLARVHGGATHLRRSDEAKKAAEEFRSVVKDADARLARLPVRDASTESRMSPSAAGSTGEGKKLVQSDQKREMEIRLSVVKGFGAFLVALPERDEVGFPSSAEKALSGLREARFALPRNVDVLFYLGSVLGSVRFDEPGSRLPAALGHLEDASRLRRRDIRVQLLQAILRVRLAVLRRDRPTLSLVEQGIGDLAKSRSGVKMVLLLSALVDLSRATLWEMDGAEQAHLLRSVGDRAQQWAVEWGQGGVPGARARYLRVLALAALHRGGKADRGDVQRSVAHLSQYAKAVDHGEAHLVERMEAAAVELLRAGKPPAGLLRGAEIQEIFE